MRARGDSVGARPLTRPGQRVTPCGNGGLQHSTARPSLLCRSLNTLAVHWLADAQVVRKELLKQLGTDLTNATHINPFWHTGRPVDMHSGSASERKPWVYLWRVSLGLACGCGRSTPETWHAYVRRCVREHMFPY